MSDLIDIIFDDRPQSEPLSINEKFEKLEPFLKKASQILFYIHEQTNPPNYNTFYFLVGKIKYLVGREITIDANFPNLLEYNPRLIKSFLLYEIVAACELKNN